MIDFSHACVRIRQQITVSGAGKRNSRGDKRSPLVGALVEFNLQKKNAVFSTPFTQSIEFVVT